MGTSQGPRKKGKEKSGYEVSTIGENPSQVVESSIGHNQFAVLSPSEVLEEGELQQIDGLVFEIEGIVVDPPLSNFKVGDVPFGDSSPPSYVDIAHKKLTVNPGSSDEESVDFSKNIGKKSKKEICEEEAKRLKTQGSQSTIEMSYGQNKRTRPLKGVATPSNQGK